MHEGAAWKSRDTEVRGKGGGISSRQYHCKIHGKGRTRVKLIFTKHPKKNITIIKSLKYAFYQNKFRIKTIFSIFVALEVLQDRLVNNCPKFMKIKTSKVFF